MSKYFDLGAAIFALAAAGFWFSSAVMKMPQMVSYFDYVPEHDPYRVATKRVALLNSIAAALSGLSALCSFFSWAAHV